MQASGLKRLPFDPFALFQNGLVKCEVDMGRCDVVQALVVALVVVMIDAGFDLGFEVPGQEVVFQQDPVFQGLMPSFDLAPGLRVIWRTARVPHAFVLPPFSEVARDIAGPIIAQQAWLLDDMNLITARCLQRQIEGVCHILSAHGRAELPRDDVAAVIVQHRAEIEPAPANYLDVGKVGLPQLVDGRCLMLELIRGFQHDECGAGDQVMCLERAIHRGLRYKVPFLICERHRQLAG